MAFHGRSGQVIFAKQITALSHHETMARDSTILNSRSGWLIENRYQNWAPELGTLTWTSPTLSWYWLTDWLMPIFVLISDSERASQVYCDWKRDGGESVIEKLCSIINVKITDKCMLQTYFNVQASFLPSRRAKARCWFAFNHGPGMHDAWRTTSPFPKGENYFEVGRSCRCFYGLCFEPK